MKNYPFFLSTIFLASACAQPSTRLYDAVRESYAKPPCDSIIGAESAYTNPVPLDNPGLFRVYYYAESETPQKPFYFYTPFGEAIIDLKSGNPLSCDRLLEQPRKIYGDSFTKQADRLAKKEPNWDVQLAAQTESIGALYQSKKMPSSMDKKMAEKYFKLFEIFSEPALEPYYYRANPDFWEWLRALIGRSLPKPG
ncbi:MAG: hypothetical protein KGL39_60610 [Patescibacteria group bacterium]|nr:hypothetical protein [Patescibacteria group bacterium]